MGVQYVLWCHTNSEQAEFSIKKGLLMDNYKYAVAPAIKTELTKMFIPPVLHVPKAQISPTTASREWPPASALWKLLLLPPTLRPPTRLLEITISSSSHSTQSSLPLSKADFVTSSSSSDTMSLLPSSNANCQSPT